MTPVLPKNRIVCDIETIPTEDLGLIEEIKAPIIEKRDADIAELAPPGNIKDPEKIAAWWATTAESKKAEIFFKAEEEIDKKVRATSFDGGYGRVAVVCLKVEDDEPISIYQPGHAYRDPDYQRWILNETNRELARICGHYQGQSIIGHNVKFDRTFLRQKGMVLGIRMHPLISMEVKPWETERVIDTMQLWTGDYRDSVKLEKLCKLFGVAGKGSELGEGQHIDGSEVWDYVQRGEIDKVALYCAGDVNRTWAVYQRLTFMGVRGAAEARADAGVDETAAIPGA